MSRRKHFVVRIRCFQDFHLVVTAKDAEAAVVMAEQQRRQHGLEDWDENCDDELPAEVMYEVHG
jgi:hypothetical protein